MTTEVLNDLVERLTRLEKDVREIKESLGKSKPAERAIDLTKCPEGTPKWLYEVVLIGKPIEKEIMMRQLVRNQALEFYVTSITNPPSKAEKLDKESMASAYIPSAHIGDYAFSESFQMGNVKGNWCDFSVNSLPAQKFFTAVGKIESPELVAEIKAAYNEALKYHKAKYNLTKKSFDKVFVPEVLLESSNVDLAAYWKRLPGIIQNAHKYSA